MPTVSIAKATIYFETRGEGTPLLMLLPQSSGPQGLEPLLVELARHHTVITYHQRGTGLSSRWTEPVSIAQQAADAARVLDAVNAEHAYLCGHSTGCGIALSLVGETGYPSHGLLLANPWTFGDEHLRNMQRLRIVIARALDPEQYARHNAALLFPPTYRREHQDGFAELYERARAAPHNAQDIENRLEAILAFDARPMLPHLRLPITVVTSTDDQLMPSWFAEEIAENAPDAELIKLQGGGHMLPETRRADIVRSLLAMTGR
tara:strand:- start:2384 stop:3172 length:789 start_codon:yes stop_codon:yes gene_type:complete